LDQRDQLTLEWSGAYARYHAAMVQTLIIEKACEKHQYMHVVAREALEASEAGIIPGKPWVMSLQIMLRSSTKPDWTMQD
jgi:Xaa-Pro dipeptidase